LELTYFIIRGFYETFSFISLFISYIFYAQPVTSVDSTASLPMQRGQWAIQFRVTSNFTLSHFNGANFAAKYHFSERSALRLVLTIDAQDRTSDDRPISYYNISSYSKEDYANNDFGMVLEPQFLYYITYERNPAVYVGGGPSFAFGNSKHVSSISRYRENEIYSLATRERKSSSYSLGIIALAGVEIFVNDYLSFHAEYASSFTYSEKENKEIRWNRYYETSEADEIEFASSDKDYKFRYKSVLFGLSVYF
jgi:hypothetical protein